MHRFGYLSYYQYPCSFLSATLEARVFNPLITEALRSLQQPGRAIPMKFTSCVKATFSNLSAVLGFDVISKSGVILCETDSPDLDSFHW